MTTERLMLDLLNRIAPVYIPLRDWEGGLEKLLADLRDRKLIECETSWEFVVVNSLTREGLMVIA